MFEPDAIYEFTSERRISEHGIHQLQLVLEFLFDVPDIMAIIGDDSFVNGQGRLTKRISNGVYKQFGTRIGDEWLARMGNIANTNSVPPGHYDLAITSNMDVWGVNKALETNDSGATSCFKPGQSYHHHWLTMAADDRFYAVRVYARDDGELIGRAWLCAEPDRLVLFNAYGIMNLNQLGTALGRVLGLEYKKGKSKGNGGGNIHINHDGIILYPSGTAVSNNFGWPVVKKAGDDDDDIPF